MAKVAVQKLTKDELSRAGSIFSAVFDVISADLDTIEDFDFTNKNCVAMCVDYVYMYGPKKNNDAEFMQELYNRIGVKNVLSQIGRAYKLI